MKEIFDRIIAYMRAKPLMAAGIGIIGLLLLFPKLLKGTKRRRRRTSRRPVTVRRRRRLAAPVARRRTKRTYAKGGTRKKPWQIKGSLAAKRYMAKIRRKR